MTAQAALATKLTRMNYEEATQIAQELVALFQDVCERIEIAGSVRRKKQEDIKDVELLMQPKLEEIQVDLFRENIEYVSLQFRRAQELKADGVLRDRVDKNGYSAFSERYQRVIYKHTAVDLFVCLPPAEWGVKLILATGPAEFNKRLVTPWSMGGRALRVGQQFKNGALWDLGQKVETPTEEDVFKFLGRDFIPPEERV